MSVARTLAGAIGLLSVVACGSDGGGTSARPAPEITDAVERTYVSTGVTVDGRPHALVAGTQIRLTFDEDAVSADAGCNLLGGAADFSRGRLSVTGLVGTEMGCQPVLMQQDEWLVDLLSARPTITAGGDRLTLTSGSTVVSLVDEESARSARSKGDNVPASR